MTILTKFLSILLVAGLGLFSWITAPGSAFATTGPTTSQEMEGFFDTILSKQLADEHIAGATVAVAKDGKLFFAKGYGFADMAKQTPVVADKTLFYLGSDGKLFTWTAVMQLVEQGKLDLHTDVNHYLDFTIPATFPQPITLDHLLTHTAGFEEELGALMVSSSDEQLPLRDFLIRYMPARVYKPGMLFAYSNYGTALAGYIVQRISGEPYEQYITNHILKPLQMNQSAAMQPLPPALMVNSSKGYHYRNGTFEPVDFEWISAAPEGIVRGPATDIAKFMIAHLNGGRYGEQQILQPNTVAEMHRQHFSHDPSLVGMAYGFVESRENDQRIIWHLGESAHFVTVLALLPEQKVGLFVSYNTPPVDGDTILSAFLDHYYPLPSSVPVAHSNVVHPALASLRGSYVSTRVAHTSPEKLITWLGALQVRTNADNSLQVGDRRYATIAPNLFKQVDGERRLTYHTGANGQVTELFWGPFAFFKVAWYQTAETHLLLATICLLIFLSAVLAWLIELLLRRGADTTQSLRWTSLARRTAVLLGLVNLTLFAWFLLAMLGYADTFIYPVAVVSVITKLWWISVPLTVVLVVFTVLAWKNHTWPLTGRVHYTAVTVASLMFLAFLINWNLLSGL